jgi:hypothetical protein
MAKKKDRAFFVCPRWNEVADLAKNGSSATPASIRVHDKTVAAIKANRPLPRSTLRKALIAVSHATGTMFDVDAYIVDQRAIQAH